MATPDIISVLIHCHNLPGSHVGERTAVRLGVQKGKEVVDDVPADLEEVTFTVPVRVDFVPASTGISKFGGPYVHGKPLERFIYLCWGERLDDSWSGFGRVKIHLKHLTPHQVTTALNGGQQIEFSLEMTQPSGNPVCGSVNLHG